MKLSPEQELLVARALRRYLSSFLGWNPRLQQFTVFPGQVAEYTELAQAYTALTGELLPPAITDPGGRYD